MTRPKRFRDTSLTEEEVRAIVWDYIHCTYDIHAPLFDEHAPKLESRAQRLLPLWREWGLRDCRAAGYRVGYDSGRECGPDEE